VSTPSHPATARRMTSRSFVLVPERVFEYCMSVWLTSACCATCVRPVQDPEKLPTARPWIKALGVGLMLVVWLPLLIFVGGFAFAWLNDYRVRVEVDEARQALRLGATLSEVVLSTSAQVGSGRLLQCYEAMCADPPGFVLSKRAGGWFGVLAADGPSVSFDTVGKWRRELDRVTCGRAKITFCGRPWISFSVELDEQRRVTRIGSLSVSPD
jgi:hypothetical protein